MAGEPVDTTSPAKSIREWKSTPTAAPTADAAAPPPAKSIREWKTTPTTAPGANQAATPPASVAAAQSPVTISMTSTLRQLRFVMQGDKLTVELAS